MARPSRTALYADDRTFLWKAILRFLAILLALVGIATTAWALVNQIHTPDSLNSNSNSNNYYNNNYENYYDPYYDFASLPWTFITLGLSVIWNTANLGVLFSRNKPIHPGANVGCDLILWLGLIATGTAAVIGATGYFYYIPEEYDNGDNSGDSYGTFTNSSGTWYQLPDGTLANQTTAHDCGGFSSCSAAQQYAQSIQRKGIIIAVGAAMSFVVLLAHFALFISACRYTHARRYSAGSKHAKAITTEATKIAQQMIAEMTGPNGTFRPRSQRQSQQEAQPLIGAHGDMRETDLRTPRQPSPRSSIVDLPPPDLPHRRHEHASSGYGVAESSNGTNGSGTPAGPEIRVESPGGIHPALRGEA